MANTQHSTICKEAVTDHIIVHGADATDEQDEQLQLQPYVLRSTRTADSMSVTVQVGISGMHMLLLQR